MKKRPFLLLELSIALILLTGVIAILFSSYRELSVGKHKLKECRENIFNKQRLQLRLNQIFSGLKVFESTQTLFSYDNGVDIDPNFRGTIEGLFHLDKDNLLLVTWPENGEPRVELLMEKVESFSVRFFDPAKGVWLDSFSTPKPFMAIVKINKEEIPLFL